MRYINLIVALLFFSEPLQAQSWQPDAPSLDSQPLRLVVIGSSTAAGAGASPIDSAWVPRFTRFVQEMNPDNTVINLAMGGYQTYHLMPTGNPPPPNRPWPDSARNITRALAHRPDAIIVNLPSNDATAGYSAAEQLANFDTIVGEARAAGVPVWVCTTQPRNLGPEQVRVQLAVRDSIFSRYGDFTLNFWDQLATPGGLLDAGFDAGDGIHLNNSGHRLLFLRVVEKNIPAALSLSSPVFAKSNPAHRLHGRGYKSTGGVLRDSFLIKLAQGMDFTGRPFGPVFLLAAPDHSDFQLVSALPCPPVFVEIMDRTGQRIYHTTSTFPVQLDGKIAPPGMYWIRVQGPAFLQVLKWVKYR